MATVKYFHQIGLYAVKTYGTMIALAIYIPFLIILGIDMVVK